MDEGGSRRTGTLLYGQDAWEVTDGNSRKSLLGMLPKLEAADTRNEWVTLALQGLASWVNSFRTIRGYERAHGEWIQRVG